MANRPKTAIWASTLGTIGGITAVAGLACTLYIDKETMIFIGFYLLIASLFFASAGFLHSNGKGSYLSLIFIELLNILVIWRRIFTEPVFQVWGIALLPIAVLLLLLTIPRAVKRWVTWDRL